MFVFVEKEDGPRENVGVETDLRRDLDDAFRDFVFNRRASSASEAELPESSPDWSAEPTDQLN